MDDSTTETATELEFLRFFFDAAGNAFGPADSDVYRYIGEDFERETGKRLPDGYRRDEEDEE